MTREVADTISQEYGDASHLAVRIETHRLYSVAPVTFRDWVISLIKPSENELLLDAGCGTGNFLTPVAQINQSGSVGVDLSPSVLAEARRNLESSGVAPSLVRADVAQLPFVSSAFDKVLANFVLQYTADADSMVGEFSRVLKAEGCLFVSTGSDHSYREMLELHRKALELEVSRQTSPQVAKHFCLENGREVLARYFGIVELRRFDDALVFGSSEPFMRYYASGPIYLDAQGRSNRRIESDTIQRRYTLVKESVEDEIRAKGKFLVTKLDGVFIATQPLRRQSGPRTERQQRQAGWE